MLEGHIEINQLDRFAAACSDDTGQVDYQLRFYQDVGRRKRLSMKIQARPALECQRCLESVVIPIDAEADLELLRSQAKLDERAETIDAELDPVVIPEDGLQPLELIEDECLLALPLVAMHADCVAKTEFGGAENEAGQDELSEQVQTEKPFASLAGLRDQLKAK